MVTAPPFHVQTGHKWPSMRQCINEDQAHNAALLNVKTNRGVFDVV
jgi:hypothetical protein